MKVIEPLENLKKDLGEMVEEMGWKTVFHSKEGESSFLIAIGNGKGYIFRVNKDGGLDITYPLTVDTSTRTHEEVIKMAREYYPEVRSNQIGADIIILNHFYRSQK